MSKKRVCWLTSTAFLDTDIYILPLLADVYDISWKIILRSSSKQEYAEEIEALKQKMDIEIVKIGAKYSSLESYKTLKRMFKTVKKQSFDLIYTAMGDFPYFVPLLHSAADTDKTVVAIHNVHVPKGGVNYRLIKKYNRYTISRFKHFHTFSESQYKALREVSGGKDVLYAPFILKSYGVSDKPRLDSRVTFMNFGNIRPYKRLDVLINAAEKAAELTDVPFRVIIAGDCSDWERYQALIRHPEIFDIRIGRVDNADIPALFNESDYFVAPYQDIAQSGSAIVAINYEKPIIASDLEAFREYITEGETGYLIKPADVESLTKAMLTAVNTYNREYRGMTQNLERLKREKFSDAATARRYREFFDKLIDAKR